MSTTGSLLASQGSADVNLVSRIALGVIDAEAVAKLGEAEVPRRRRAALSVGPAAGTHTWRLATFSHFIAAVSACRALHAVAAETVRRSRRRAWVGRDGIAIVAVAICSADAVLAGVRRCAIGVELTFDAVAAGAKVARRQARI